jgi:hypothetical protein
MLRIRSTKNLCNLHTVNRTFKSVGLAAIKKFENAIKGRPTKLSRASQNVNRIGYLTLDFAYKKDFLKKMGSLKI